MEYKGYNLPEELAYEKHHYWIMVEGDLIVMGMSDFAQKLAGDIVFIQLPDEGKKIKLGKKFAKVESGKWLGKIYAPCNGILDSVNESLEEDPGLINKDCYGQGWIYKIKPNDMAELDTLIQGRDAIQSWMDEEIEKYADQV